MECPILFAMPVAVTLQVLLSQQEAAGFCAVVFASHLCYVLGTRFTPCLVPWPLSLEGTSYFLQ